MNLRSLPICSLWVALGLIVIAIFSAPAVADDHLTPKVDPQELVKDGGRYTIPAGATADTVPPGTVVTVLPEECTKVLRKDGIYYGCKNGIYLQPSVVDGEEAFVVIKKP